MAKRVTTQLVDDIDGSVIDGDSGETIEFSVNGVEYAIDLKTKNASDFHKKIGYYIDHATRVGGRKRKPSPAASAALTVSGESSSTRSREQTRAIRQWAFDHNYKISVRGRIPADIEQAYNAAH